MGDLRKFTTIYSAHEDRIRLAGHRADAGPVILWLTQRMVRRLLPPLISWLEKTDALVVGETETVQSFKQQVARATLRQQAPVQAPIESESWVVTAVDFASTPKVMRLTFKDIEDRSVRLMLTPEAARQWLNILHDATRKGEWPRDAWPSWIAQTAGGAAVVSGISH